MVSGREGPTSTMTSPAAFVAAASTGPTTAAVVLFIAVLHLNQVQLVLLAVFMMRVISVSCFQCESHPYTDWYRYGSGRYRGLVGGSFYGGRYLRNSYGDDYYYGDRGRGSYSMNGYLPGSTRSRLV